MDWIEVRYELAAEDADLACEALVADGFTAFALATGRGENQDLTLYGAETPPQAALERLAALGLRPVAQATLDEQILYAHLHPRAPILLAPGVHVQPGDEAPPPGGLVLRLPPGPAWGDGRHPTTRLLARRLLDLDVAGARVLDLGCGSGLLGILAAKRGAAEVVLTDNDDHALRVTCACCAANGVIAEIRSGDLLAAVPEGFVADLLIANLWADLVLACCGDPRLGDVLPRGCWLGSGVHVRRRDEVQAALTALGFRVVWSEEEAWWWAFEARR